MTSRNLASLLAAPGGIQSSSLTTGEMNLSQSELDSVVAAAIAQWAAAGASADQIAILQAVTFSVADLSRNIIGQEISPTHITIDVDAAGHGWFIDPTPFDNFEFLHAGNALATDLFTDPDNAAAGHLDLLTAVSHELGHVLELDDSQDNFSDLMFTNLVDGERRLPDSIDIYLAPGSILTPVPTTPSGSSERAVAAPASNGSASSGNPGNDIIDAGHGGGALFGGAGADTFVFANVNVSADRPPPVTYVMDYSHAEGDRFDFSALTSQFHPFGSSDAMIVRAVEDPSNTFATLQVNAVDASGPPGAPNWVSIAEVVGAHSGDTLSVLIDSHSAVHLAQIHVGLLV